MASFRDKQKNNPLKPRPVTIPQVDPMSSLTDYKPQERMKETLIPDAPEPEIQKKSKPVVLKQKAPIATDKSAEEQVVLFAKIPKSMKQWVDHYKVDTGKELGEIVGDALNLLRKRAGND